MMIHLFLLFWDNFAAQNCRAWLKSHKWCSVTHDDVTVPLESLTRHMCAHFERVCHLLPYFMTAAEAAERMMSGESMNIA